MIFEPYIPWIFCKPLLADVALFLLVLSVYLAGRLWRRNDWSPSLLLFVVGYLLYVFSGVFDLAAIWILSGGTFDYSSTNAISHNVDFITIFDSTLPRLIRLCGLAVLVKGALPSLNSRTC